MHHRKGCIAGQLHGATPYANSKLLLNSLTCNSVQQSPQLPLQLLGIAVSNDQLA